MSSPLPERPRNLDEAMDRGFDPGAPADVPVALDLDLLAGLRGQARAIRQMRDEDRHWDQCGDHSTRCDICGDRLCQVDGPARAKTCGAHVECELCHGDNGCQWCGYERKQA